MTTNEMQEVLNTLMRSIDKKTALTIELRSDNDAGSVMVQLRRERRTGSLQLSEADLSAARTDLMRRHHVRIALKRARDRMWEETSPIFSTKVTHEKVEGTGWFHPAQRGRARR